ncbi:MAG: four helix bundle protein [Candidatus Magasanikbacteria bacterium CG_4_9_14_0_2_um_filter_42_11]|uniref:Four helix bundle protein n=1 Tax=Candidatus Magasanikbacteria bacterium CG_4_9_14_0_2_um_filter_42_11 TaxID=1974643 RepID=A0A2M8F8W8_9BACT|nr:MAG: four helix bundle protein [Candidatus Magasanikbacteria bacterium CG_4_10_14_0_8_um_filter_42_12]PJC52195.1 MAG: four helix bundle protein [Candidatus Magasanikbacteria bacterium CG_4_9_14_0_2_um_filter_42_11]
MMEGKRNPLFEKADLLAELVYDVTKDFPKHERYGLTSQLRRAGLSVILNIIEGFARQGEKEFRRFLIIAFGSLKETKYLLTFAKKQTYMNEEQYTKVFACTEDTAKLLWRAIHPK